MTSLPRTVARVEALKTTFTESAASWASEIGDETNMRSLLTNILMWALQTDPTFPGDATDRRTDLVVEILRLFYVLRAGQYIE
jgi:hypothetical protein